MTHLTKNQYRLSTVYSDSWDIGKKRRAQRQAREAKAPEKPMFAKRAHLAHTKAAEESTDADQDSVSEDVSIARQDPPSVVLLFSKDAQTAERARLPKMAKAAEKNSPDKVSKVVEKDRDKKLTNAVPMSLERSKCKKRTGQAFKKGNVSQGGPGCRSGQDCLGGKLRFTSIGINWRYSILVLLFFVGQL